MSRRFSAGLIFLACLVVYNANLRYTGSADSLAASQLPFRLLRGHGLTLEEPRTIPEAMRYSYFQNRRGQWISLYPVLTPLAVTPLYAPAILLEKGRPWVNHLGIQLGMQKLSASIIASASTLVLLLTLRKITSEKLAIWLTVAYAFGTSTWAISSQSLWQHGMGELLLCLALLLLAGGIDTPPRLAILGMVAGLLAANRPTDALFSIALAGIVLWDRRSRAWPFFLAAAPIGALLVAYNLAQFGTLTGGYAHFHYPNSRAFGLEPLNVSGFLGLLFSNRGIFFFSPFLLLVFLRRWKEEERIRGLRVLLFAYVSSLFLHGLAFDWMGGYCYGPRYALHGLPVLVVALVEPLERIWKLAWARATFVGAAVLSIAIQAIGAFFYPNGDSGDWHYGLWTIRKSPPMLALRAGPAMPDFPALLPRSVRHPGLDPADAACRLAWAAPVPASLRSGESARLRVRVTNAGRSRWSSVGSFFNFGALRFRWIWTNDRDFPVGEYAWLAWTLEPGQSLERSIVVTAPPFSGNVHLEVGLEQMRIGELPPSSCRPLVTTIQVNE